VVDFLLKKQAFGRQGTNPGRKVPAWRYRSGLADVEMASRFVVKQSSSGENLAVELVGGKCARLAQMACCQLRVPRWFCVTTEAFRRFLQYNAIDPFSGQPDAVTHRQRVTAAPFPAQIQKEILDATRDLLRAAESGALAVRSSATAEDAPQAAHAGQFDTFLGLIDEKFVLHKIRQCFASLWSDRATKYRIPNTQHPTMAVLVQTLIPSDVSGTMFTANPVTGRRDEVMIESSWGLGELLVGGEVVPDHFVVKVNAGSGRSQILKSRVGSKFERLGWNVEKRQLERAATPLDRQNALTLTQSQILALVDVGLTLQAHWAHPQDVEWAISRDEIYILQSRPITTL
jgi:pyruvate,water dikinase